VNKTIGIIGDGQLGRMLAESASKLGCEVRFFTDYTNLEAAKLFADSVDVITYEFENIPIKTIEFLEESGKVFPNKGVLWTAQNRQREKEFFGSLGIKTANWKIIDVPTDAIFAKGIIKTLELGYDGKGQYRSSEEIPAGTYIWEEFVNFAFEASIIIARSKSGEVKCFPLADNVHKSGILHTSTVPSKANQQAAENIAIKVAEKLDLVGLLAIEFFVMADGSLIANEMAPRPHNSGHYTQLACITSQFEQHLRAILNLPLGDTDILFPAMMLNLIGDDDYSQYLNNPKASIHLYGKKEARKGRKMGHINFMEC
jgi:5-(carboxyamino)imidazole ribonucleotide synthase